MDCQGLVDAAAVQEQTLSQAIMLAILDDDAKEQHQLMGKKPGFVR